MVKRLLNIGLQINTRKCEFEAIKTKYLVIIMTPEGIEMNPVRGVGSLFATGDPLLTSISNLRKERKEI
jgi:hypothetical protein